MTKTKIFLVLSVLVLNTVLAQKDIDLTKIDKNMTVNTVKTKGIKWYSPKDKPFRLMGFKWIHEDSIYRRLPIKVNNITIPRKVNLLADQTSGGQIHFKTNSKRILIKVQLKPSQPLYHMTQVAKQGFDLYVGKPHKKIFNSSTKFEYDTKNYTSRLYSNASGEMKEFTINFPLYNGVESVYIGLDENSQVIKPSPLVDKKNIVIYGTSITHGGCASRPGMSYPNILSRKLNKEVINLGFSGSGKGELEVAELISLIKHKSLVIIDIECNTHEALRSVLAPFIETLRRKDNQVPILVLSRISLARDQNPKNLKKRIALMNFQKKPY